MRSDEVRKELAGIRGTADASAPLDQGIYDSAWTERTYTALCDRARKLLNRGQSVVLDASWSDRQWRALAEVTAAEATSRLIAVRCSAPVGVTTKRAARRFMDDEDASDANAAIAAVAAERFMPWPEARVLDTTSTPAEVSFAAVSIVGRF